MTEALYDAEELAERLKVPVSTVRYWRSRGEGPPAVLVGKHLRWRPADVDAWLGALSGDVSGSGSTAETQDRSA